MHQRVPPAARLLLTAAGVLAGAASPSWAAGVANPLDPAGPPGAVPTENIFEGRVPLLDREAPAPSFAGEAEAPPAESDGAEAPPAASDDGGHDHARHGALRAVAE